MLVLQLSNSNQENKRIEIEVFGYDLLMVENFVDSEAKPKTKKLDKSLQEIYLGIDGNYKLLTISNKKGKTRIPMSNQLNKFSTDLLSCGKNILELKNLGTGHNKICIIKLK